MTDISLLPALMGALLGGSRLMWLDTRMAQRLARPRASKPKYKNFGYFHIL